MWWIVQKSQRNILSHLLNATSPGEHALHKDNFATENGEISKVIAYIKTVAPLLFANKSTVKHAPWSNSPAVVSDTLFLELYVMRVFSSYFSQLIAKVRPDEYCISAVHKQFLAATSRASSE